MHYSKSALALAALTACLLAACQEPNSTPPQASVAAPASTAPAAATPMIVAAAVPGELTADQVKVVLKPDTLCNLERIDNQVLESSPFTPKDPHRANVTGWMGDEASKGLPTNPALMIRQLSGGRVWQVPVALTVGRDDVAKVTSADALKTSGFSLDVDFSALPAGEYRLVLVHERDGEHFACDNGRDLKL